MRKNILIVEDDRTAALVISNHLESSGYRISGIAESGKEALETLEKGLPDLILMDISLGGSADGIETAGRVNELYSVPIIFVTSSSDKKTIERSQSVNPFGYIIKPVDKNELKTCIEIALNRFSMESALKANEHKLAAILNSIGDAVIVIDRKGLITYVNPVAEKMLQDNSAQIINLNIDDLIIFEHSINFKRIFSIKDCDNDLILLKNQTRIPVNYTVSPLKDPRGRITGAVVIIRDDTERVKARQKLTDSFERLRKTMGGVVETMARALESRDPYTAGHQRRVSDLARTIAASMNLPEDKIEGIRMSAMIHDIGKISIPSEILSKPGILTEIEFSMMKTHPETGYTILQNIDFPWPVAEIVYQHHEYIDGSGYPRGLKGDALLIEAKIISVADVIEAMASHRPYRPSLGIDAALEEIYYSRNIHFDPDIVDICLNLFRNEGYRMAS